MKKIIIIYTILIVISCKKQNNSSEVSAEIDIQYKDSVGTDLLDSSKIYSFKYSGMKHYYLTGNNVKVEVNIPNADYPKDLFIYRDRDTMPYTLRLFVHEMDAETGTSILTDILELNSIVSDTIRSQYYVSEDGSLRIIQKVWYNNKLVNDGTSLRKLEIIK